MKGKTACADLDQSKVDQFVERLLSDSATVMHGLLCYVGDRLGIFSAMAKLDTFTLDQLAAATKLNQRYLQEWLGSMVAAKYVDYDASKKTYCFPKEHALPLADDSFPYFFGGIFQQIAALAKVTPQVAESFKTGKGVKQDQYSADLFEGIERTSGSWYKNQLIQNWLPTMPDVIQKLQAGAKVCDVGCGCGQAAIVLAKAFPKSEVLGFDNHDGSLERAKQNATTSGAGGNLKFQVIDCTKLPSQQFDLITAFDVIHDSVAPVDLLKSIQQALKDDGTFLMVEMNVSNDVAENISDMGKLLYSISTLYCMTTSLAEGGAGIGALMGESKARELAIQAGFREFRRLPIEDPFSALYELKP
jgi:2-polyprenyl-3-methyl-5-hydroxy-6-metoxy-1,4-benzoquinol methylase